ncbi:MAG TPA: site-2 protease family protein [Candidatus Solibacter sp.]|nr:site-2 protease family protein [Candidatus Solibacter sp.]
MSETPIFDLEQDPPLAAPRPRSELCGLVFCICWGALVGICIKSHSFLTNAALWLPLVYGLLAIHELGHLMVGKIMGMRLDGFAVGGLCVYRAGTRWRCRFDRYTAPLGGFVICSPGERPHDRMRLAWFFAGGPIASIVFGAASGTAVLLSGGYWNWIASAFWINLSFTLTSLVYSSGLRLSDGAGLKMFLSNAEQSCAYIASTQLSQENDRGVPPCDWNAGLFDQVMKTAPSMPYYIHSRLLAYYRYRACGDDATALRHLETALVTPAVMANPVRRACFLEAAFAGAAVRRKPESAKVWRDRAYQLGKLPQCPAVEAVIAFAEERYSDALALFAEAHAQVDPQQLDSGMAHWCREVWSGYELQCRTAVHS